MLQQKLVINSLFINYQLSQMSNAVENMFEVSEWNLQKWCPVLTDENVGNPCINHSCCMVEQHLTVHSDMFIFLCVHKK